MGQRQKYTCTHTNKVNVWQNVNTWLLLTGSIPSKGGMKQQGLWVVKITRDLPGPAPNLCLHPPWDCLKTGQWFFSEMLEHPPTYTSICTQTNFSPISSNWWSHHCISRNKSPGRQGRLHGVFWFPVCNSSTWLVWHCRNPLLVSQGVWHFYLQAIWVTALAETDVEWHVL